MNLWIRSILAFSLFIFSFTQEAFARRIWQENGVPLATGTGWEVMECIIDDESGAGGKGGNLIVFWHEGEYPLERLYAQSVDISGNIRWAPGGVEVSSRSGRQYSAVAVPDLAGGCLVFWMDHQGTNEQIYGQHLDSSGNRLWGTAGMAVCPYSGNQLLPNAVSDGSGGAVVAWIDDRNDIGNEDSDIYAQRITKQGTRLYPADGSLVCYATTPESYPYMLSDGSGGAFICWRTSGNTELIDIYAQKLNAEGIIQWGVYGAAVCTASEYQGDPAIAHGASGKYWVAWEDHRSGDTEIYMQSLSPSGVSLWAANGQSIGGYSDHAFSPSMVSDGAGGAFVSYRAERWGSTGLYLRHIRDTGALLFHDDMPVYEGPGLTGVWAGPDARPAGMVKDGHGGCFMVWPLDDNVDPQCYVQHISSRYRKSYGGSGMPVTATTVPQNYSLIVQNGMKKAVVAWQDWWRRVYPDIYAQRFMVQPPLSGVVPLLLE